MLKMTISPDTSILKCINGLKRFLSILSAIEKKNQIWSVLKVLRKK